MKLKNMFFRLSLPSLGLSSAQLSIIYCLGGRRIFGKGGGGSHGFKLEQRGISRRQKSKNCLMGDQENCIVTQPISADPSGDK